MKCGEGKVDDRNRVAFHEYHSKIRRTITNSNDSRLTCYGCDPYQRNYPFSVMACMILNLRRHIDMLTHACVGVCNSVGIHDCQKVSEKLWTLLLWSTFFVLYYDFVLQLYTGSLVPRILFVGSSPEMVHIQEVKIFLKRLPQRKAMTLQLLIS